MQVLKVSDGLGNHLPEPCSEQLKPLATIVPAGNKKISTYLNPPRVLICVLSKLTIAFCILSKTFGGYMLANSNLLEILTISLAYEEAISSLSSSLFYKL